MFVLLRLVGVVWLFGFVVFAAIATSTYLFSSAPAADRSQRWSARLGAAIIWPIAVCSSAGRTRLFKGF
jgi:hypothetical protein